MQSTLFVVDSIQNKDNAHPGISAPDQVEDVIRDLKKAGSDAMDEDRYWDAIDNFSLVLFYREDASVLANRSMAYLELDNYYMAYIDANEALKLKDDFAEAWFLKALALSGLKYYTEARECLDVCLEVNPNNTSAKIAKFSIASMEDNYQVEPDKLLTYDPKEPDSPRLIDLLTGQISDLNINDSDSDLSEGQFFEELESDTYVATDEDNDDSTEYGEDYEDEDDSTNIQTGESHEFGDNSNYFVFDDNYGAE